MPHFQLTFIPLRTTFNGVKRHMHTSDEWKTFETSNHNRKEKEIEKMAILILHILASQ